MADFDIAEECPAPPKPIEEMTGLELAHWLLMSFVARTVLHEHRGTELTPDGVAHIRAWTLDRLKWEADAIGRQLTDVDLKVRALGRELEFDVVPAGPGGALAIGEERQPNKGHLR
jgi:hypothetical protein